MELTSKITLTSEVISMFQVSDSFLQLICKSFLTILNQPELK